jgi:DNA gyrase/topoisomerase IV subunit A
MPPAALRTWRGNRQAIVVDEIPYQVNKANLLGRIGELVREKKLEGISDLRDGRTSPACASSSS